jgi:hypothetical protein
MATGRAGEEEAEEEKDTRHWPPVGTTAVKCGCRYDGSEVVD